MDFNLIENDLINFEKPARYIGNELLIPNKDFLKSPVKFLICYPDIYEIGMSNLGIKIIYDRINKLDFASCERVFSPWNDFEEYLKKNNYELFSLESKTPVKNFDFVGFSIQYELLFTNFLNILKLGKINILSKDRNNDEPIILCGGPAIVNPAPYSPFADLFLIGEGEVVIESLLNKYNELKKNLSDRKTILQELSMIDGIYSPVYSKKKVKRQIYTEFYNQKKYTDHIIPIIDIIQNKFVVEIMRGCPNKCRFCQAGVIYKPYRERESESIIDEIDNGIKKFGSTEITLSSLSSGDYSQIIDLAEYFNKKYSRYNISFSLPSIKVESFDIDLLDKISFIRKSGLTFAIETGSIDGQLSINKIVMIDKINKIIDYAIKHGWKLVKFYFMVGLPGIENEANTIINFIDKLLLQHRRINFNLNIATFVPKPHTPFQYERQISLEESIKIIEQIEAYYKHSRVKVKKHNPYMSYIEGFISRGDEEVGLAMLDAFNSGARFDGWEDIFDFEIYNNIFNSKNLSYEKYLDKKDINSKMPWDNIDIGINKDYFIKELDKSNKKMLTKNCKEECEKECSLCNKDIKRHDSSKFDYHVLKSNEENLNQEWNRYLLEFSKLNLLKFIGHIDVLTYFEKLFLRAGIIIKYSQGFNPHPKLQFSSALSVGIESKCEILEFYASKKYQTDELLSKLKSLEHRDLPINRLKKINLTNKISLYENIQNTIYSFNYDEKYSSKINQIFSNFNDCKYKYHYEKKDIKNDGNYQDFIFLESISKNKLFLNIKKTSSVPKIIQFKQELIGNVPVNIIKENELTLNNGKFINLFDSIY
jgi:radical SAM family uncharacterized protein/radical SAM-linked protein